METKVTLKVVRTGVNRVLILYSEIENATLFVTMDTSCKLYFPMNIFFSYVPATALVDYELPCPSLYD